MSLVGFLPVHLQGFYGWLIFVKSDAVCVCGLSVGHGYLSMAVLFSSIEATLIEEQQ